MARSASASLAPVPSTLRIPLAARAWGDSVFPEVAVGDAYAGEVLAAIGDGGVAWLDDRASVYGILARTREFRAQAQDWLRLNPTGTVVNLGCGLAHYAQWLDNGRMHLVEADLPEVLALRRRLLPAPDPRHRWVELDLAAADWWHDLGLPPRPEGAPIFVLCEGVLMYLEPAIARGVLATFADRAPPGSRFVFDALSAMAVGHASLHPSVRHTGAEFLWGLHRLSELTAASPRLHLRNVAPVMEGYNLPYALWGPAFRLVFGVPLYAVYRLDIDETAT